MINYGGPIKCILKIKHLLKQPAVYIAFNLGEQLPYYKISILPLLKQLTMFYQQTELFLKVTFYIAKLICDFTTTSMFIIHKYIREYTAYSHSILLLSVWSCNSIHIS